MKGTKQTWLSVCVALGLAAAAVPTWAKETAGSVIDDTVLTTRIKAALIENPATKARQINVETDHGVVQLNGFVETAEEKAAAETAAGAVSGVKRVDNNLQLRNGARTAGNVVDDTTITSRIKAKLIADPVTKAYQVEVKTFKGVVSLGGFVKTNAEREAAEKLAMQVAGVVKVENGIMLKQG